MQDNDLISRAAAIESLGECPYNWNDWPEEIQAVDDWESHKKALEDLPAVAAVPVVHGRWIEVGDFIWKCSVCGAEDCHAYTWGEVKRQDDLYCPKCGAKMNGGDNDA